ncbi:MAG: hypothetical protein R8M38_08135, partial [Mariprofundaceae bacterium]
MNHSCRFIKIAALWLLCSIMLAPVVMAAPGDINTVAGNGLGDFGNNNGQATEGDFVKPAGMTFDALGNLYIADEGDHTVRKITPADTVSTLASGLLNSGGAVFDTAGNLYVANAGKHRIIKITPAGGVSVIAGTGIAGFAGDTASATAAQLNNPKDIKIDSLGDLYVADTGNNRIRKITMSVNPPTIDTVAGGGTAVAPGFGDNTAATSAVLSAPS